MFNKTPPYYKYKLKYPHYFDDGPHTRFAHQDSFLSSQMPHAGHRLGWPGKYDFSILLII